MIRALRVAGTIGLWAIGLAGLAGAALWALAQFGVAQPLVVVSESMRPALRTGDLVLAVRVPVTELAPGDIVSVARDDASRFITHRVVRAEQSGPNSSWSLVLKGDANPIADPEPYSIGSHALKVVWSAPLGLPTGGLVAAEDDAHAATAHRPPLLALTDAAWTDVVHAVVALTSPVAGPAPYAIATSTAWDRVSGTSGAVCPDGSVIEYAWAPSGGWVSQTGGGDAPAIELVFGWNQYVTLHTQARCWQDGRVSDWVPASNNGVGHGIWVPYVSDTSGYTNASTRRFEAHFGCPAWTTSAVTWIGVRRSGSSPTTALWSTAGTDLVVHWSGTMGNGSVWMAVSCTGPWGTITRDATHLFGPGCVPTITVAICTDYYRG